MIEILKYATVAGIGAIGYGFANRMGGLIAEGGLGRVKADTVARDNQSANTEVLEKMERLREEKTEVIEQKERRIEEVESRLTEYERITRSLKEDSLARERLIERYWKPLHAVLICFTAQKDSEGNTEKFIKEKLEDEYTLHPLTGFTYIIPPADVPPELKQKRNTRKDIKNWIENDLYKKNPDAKSIICFAGVVDLRNVYSRSDYALDEQTHLFSTIDEELGLEDIFNEDDFSKLLASEGVNLAKIIEEGDIAFFTSKSVKASELDKIHENQDDIEAKLGNPDLKQLVKMEKSRIADALSPYVENPIEVAESVGEEATIWKKELYQ